MQGGGLARTVGPEHCKHLARGHREFDVQTPVGDDRAQLQLAHDRLPGIGPDRRTSTHTQHHQCRYHNEQQ